MTSSSSTFSIEFCFLTGERRGDFIWAFRRIKQLGVNPALKLWTVIKPQKTSIEQASPGILTLLCIWHFNQCALAKRKNVMRHEGWPKFYDKWRGIKQASTTEQLAIGITCGLLGWLVNTETL